VVLGLSVENMTHPQVCQVVLVVITSQVFDLTLKCKLGAHCLAPNNKEGVRIMGLD